MSGTYFENNGYFGNNLFEENRKEFNNRRPIHIACENGSIEVIKLLINNNCNINACDRSNNCPIHIACEKGFIEISKLLIDNQCNIEVCNELHQYPIHIACSKGFNEIVEMLIENNCNIYVVDKFDQTPLEIAFNKKQKHTINILLDKVEKDVMSNFEINSDLSNSNYEMGSYNEDERFQKISQEFFRMKDLNRQPIKSHSNNQVDIFNSSADFNSYQNDIPSNNEMRYDCKICFQYKINIALNCGHTLCNKCVGNLTKCHVCRSIITSYTEIYL